MCCARLKSSWIMATSGPGTSGFASGRRRASPARKGSLCSDQPRGTAPSLGSGQEPLLSVTTMVGTDNNSNLTHDKALIMCNDYVQYMAIFFPIKSMSVIISTIQGLHLIQRYGDDQLARATCKDYRLSQLIKKKNVGIGSFIWLFDYIWIYSNVDNWFR